MWSGQGTILVWCHGGCFGGGQVLYDAQLRKTVKANGYEVTAVDFTKSYPVALTEIAAAATYHMQQGYRVIMGGISSGGMLAHMVANQLKLPALLIAPVLGPYSRHDAPGVLTDSQRELQLSFFGDMDTMFKAEQEALAAPNSHRCIIYGRNDGRAPEDNFIGWTNLRPLRVELYEVEASHSKLCQHPPLDNVITCLSIIQGQSMF